MRIAVAQIISGADPTANLELVWEYAAQAKNAGAQLVVFPEATMRVARAAFPKGNVYLQMRDQLGTLYTDADFTTVYPTRGQPASYPSSLGGRASPGRYRRILAGPARPFCGLG